MSCNLTAGWTVGCSDSNGGVEAVFIANGKVEGFTESNGIVSAITVGGSPLVPADFFTFEVPKQTSLFEEELEASTENGTVMYTQNVTLVFNKLEAVKRNQILLMAQNEDLIVVVKDNNGKYWSVGLERGATVVSGTLSTGTSYADRNGGELTITGMEKLSAFEVEEAILVA